MKRIISHSTALDQWQRLVVDAEAHTTICLNEELQSYLVFLLMRFVDKPEMAASVLALDFINTLEQAGVKRTESLREIGDKCLLFAGLFPERAERKNVDVNYFVNLGRNAYHELSAIDKINLAKLFASLCEQFMKLLDVLQTIRQLKREEIIAMPGDSTVIQSTSAVIDESDELVDETLTKQKKIH